MGRLAGQIIADLHSNGLTLHEVGDGWFAVHVDPHLGAPEAFLHLVDGDIERYVEAMSAEDIEGVFGPDVTLADASYRLALIHLEEQLLSYHGGIRCVVVDGEQIRTFETGLLPSLSPGEYEWRSVVSA